MSVPAATIAGHPADDVFHLRRLTALAFWTLLSLLWLAALTVCWRRWAGALVAPAPARLLLVAGVSAALVAALARRSWIAAGRTFAWWLPSGALLLLAVALSLPGASTLGWLVLWAPLLIEEAWTFRRWRPVEPTGPVVAEAAQRLPADASQQLTRSLTADGHDRLDGRLRVAFAPGQRSVRVDVAFCPPFALAPELAAEVPHGPPARVKPLQVLAYGARLDVRLVDLLDEPADVLVEFAATGPTPNHCSRSATAGSSVTAESVGK